MKLLLITLEYKASTFSGNGVYSQSIVQSLVRGGHDVFVISAKPRAIPGKPTADGKDKKARSASSAAAAPRRGEGRLVEMEVEVDRRNWGRLDWKSPWESFAAGVSRECANKVGEFAPDWALVVDWSGVPAFSKLLALGSQSVPMAFLNFRIYYLSQYGGEDGQLERNFYRFMESRAVSMSAAIAALSSGDAQVLATDLATSVAPGVVPKALWPPLRKDMRILASPPPVPGYMRRTAERVQLETTDTWAKDRKFFTCCVRLSPEKNALMFAMIVEKLAGFLAEHDIIPAICGGAKEDAYGKTVKDRVKKASPLAVIYETFMGAADMAELYSKTLLNVHPCVYDAYGMTIVEAAAFGTPSLVHSGKGGIVGAAELLDPHAGFAFAVDMNASVARIAEEIKIVLRNKQLLATAGKAASIKSLAWDEDANSKQLLEILQAGYDNLKHQGNLN